MCTFICQNTASMTLFTDHCNWNFFFISVSVLAFNVLFFLLVVVM